MVCAHFQFLLFEVILCIRECPLKKCSIQVDGGIERK